MISSKARIGASTTFGEYCVVEDGAVLGSGCAVGSHVVIHVGSVIGDNVQIDDFASIGKQPMKRNSAQPPARIGDGCLIGTGAVLYAGCAIGPRCLIADYATVREQVVIGENTVVGRGAAIENDCKIGGFCKIETNAYLCAHSTVEDHCFIAPCVVTSNDNFAARSKRRFGLYQGLLLRRGGRIGAGAVILPGREIAPDGFAAAGSVVTKDVPAGVVVAGCPARELRNVPEEQLLKNNLPPERNDTEADGA